MVIFNVEIYDKRERSGCVFAYQLPELGSVDLADLSSNLFK